jgi:HK97 family phage major capsid protein
MSITRAQELRREKAAKAEQLIAIGKLTATEKRSLTSEEREAVDKIDGDIKALGEDIERLERIEALQVEQAAVIPVRTGGETKLVSLTEEERDLPPEAQERVASEKKRIKAYSHAFGNYLRMGLADMESEERKTLEAGKFNVKMPDLPQEVRQIVRAALGTGVDVLGGYTLPPEPARGLIEGLKAYGGMRKSRAEVITTSHGREIPWITTDDTSNEGRLIGEARPAAEATDVNFGQKSLNAYIYTTDYVKVAFTLSQDTEFDIEGHLNKRFAERLGRVTERHFATGDGQSKPEGITISAQLGRSGPTGQTTAIKYADWVNLFHSVDPAYRDNFEWMFHDTTLLASKLILDGQGRPLWRSGLATREPDTIEDKPYIVNNSMPVMAASAKSVVGGDFSYYKIRDVTPPFVVRLTERFIEYGQVAYLMFSRHDGKLLHGANTANTAALCPVKYYQNSAS